jgi:hypothetical protein
MRGANAQNSTIHKRMRNTPTRRRNGDGPADFVSSVTDHGLPQRGESGSGQRARAAVTFMVVQRTGCT